MPRALLLTGSLGMGHDVMAQACDRELRRRDWAASTLDAMKLLGRRGGSAGEAVFRGMLATPGLYDAFHFAALRPGTRLALLADAGARRQLVPRLRAALDASPADLAISVFATGASAISAVAGRYPAMAHMVFCCDATPHRLWVQPNVDLYLVTSPVARAAVLRYQPRAQILVVPPPVRPGFGAPPPMSTARAALGVPACAPCVLLMSGAWGLGPIAQAAAELAAGGVHVLAVAGRNGRLEKLLRQAAVSRPRLHPFGFTDRVPDLMAAADLVITSSGDTCTEARAVGRPLLLLDVVQGHGRDNLQHELELGEAWVTSPRPGDVVRSALAVLASAKPAKDRLAPAPDLWGPAFGAALSMIGR